jgi:hypothetical protein
MISQHRRPVAGLVPATHALAGRQTGQPQDVDARAKPGQGGFY